MGKAYAFRHRFAGDGSLARQGLSGCLPLPCDARIASGRVLGHSVLRVQFGDFIGHRAPDFILQSLLEQPADFVRNFA